MRLRVVLPILAAATLAGCGGGSSSAPTTTATSSEPVTITIDIKGGKPVGGITRATVDKNSRVRLIVHSDVADEVHLHGYDLHQDVDAGGTAEIDFKADIAGKFEAELESRSLQILALTVK